jgi:hypothetical protein
VLGDRMSDCFDRRLYSTLCVDGCGVSQWLVAIFCCEVGRPLLPSEHEACQASVGSLPIPTSLPFFRHSPNFFQSTYAIASPWKFSVKRLISAGTVPV